MSIYKIVDSWKHSKAEGAALLILLAMADFANEDGICWPSITTLATRGRVHTRTAQRAVRELEQLGEIVCTKRGSGSSPSVYKVVVGEEQRGGIMPGVEEQRGGNTPGEGRQYAGGGAVLRRPNRHITVIEPSKKTQPDKPAAPGETDGATKGRKPAAFPGSHYEVVEQAFGEAYEAKEKKKWLNTSPATSRARLMVLFRAGQTPEEVAVRARAYIQQSDGTYWSRTVEAFVKHYNDVKIGAADKKAAASFDVGRV